MTAIQTFRASIFIACTVLPLVANAKLSANDLGGVWIVDHLDGTGETQTFDPTNQTVILQDIDLRTQQAVGAPCTGTYSFDSDSGALTETYSSCGNAAQVGEKVNFAGANFPKSHPPGFTWGLRRINGVFC